MPGQYYDWTCSVCSTTWVLQSTGALDPSIDAYTARNQVGYEIGYPSCVNETYGCMSVDCIKNEFQRHGFNVGSSYVTFDQAYAIMSHTTGTINPQGMYHFMAIRGVNGDNLWVANSAPGYMGVWDELTRYQFDSLGPVEIVYLEP